VTAHSPGPWRWEEKASPDELAPTQRSLVDANGAQVAWGYVATMYDDDLPTGISAEGANARLIATAPELLAEVIGLVHACDRLDAIAPGQNEFVLRVTAERVAQMKALLARISADPPPP
jgi:hypothetical protein